MNSNFINKAGRTYLIRNPDTYGNGTELGYYRANLFDGYSCVAKKPYHQEKTVKTEQEAQQWLEKFTK